MKNEQITEVINQNKDKILSLSHSLLDNPELGYEERISSSLIKEAWSSMGLNVEGPYGLTGLRAVIKGSKPGPTVCLIGELDAVISPQNKNANKEGTAHACGHFLQSTGVYAAAIALNEIKEELSGSVVLLETPAEEFLELEKRIKLKEEEKISYLSGKPELLKEGAFRDVDIALMIHAHPNTPEYKLFLGGKNLGFVAKNIRFIGKASHASTPFEGKNALQAATLFINGINANRETFKDDESIRIHPIITKGGDIVNSIPDDVRVELYVRGVTKEAIDKGTRIVDRCAKAASEMMDITYEMETIPGYLPLKQDKNLTSILHRVASPILGEENIEYGVDSVGSSDIGDISQMIPTLQPTMGGYNGGLHSSDFSPVDIWQSALKGGELLASLVYELLKDDGKEAKNVISSFVPSMTKEEYFKYLDN